MHYIVLIYVMGLIISIYPDNWLTKGKSSGASISNMKVEDILPNILISVQVNIFLVVL